MSQKPLLVIVGAGPGVAAGVAGKFGSEGFRIVLVARTERTLNDGLEELRGRNIESYGVTADASDPDSLIRAFERIRAEYGDPDVLVYNVANIVRGNALELSEEQLLQDLKGNVVGALTSAKQVIPSMIERKSGTLFFTGGTISLRPNPEYASLSMGKAAIRSLALSLAETLSPHGIYVGQVLIGGHVRKGTYYDPDRIAETFWDLYVRKDRQEAVYQQ